MPKKKSKPKKSENADRKNCIGWLKWYGAGKFYDAFVQTVQDARGTCRNCQQAIYLDIIEGGGAPDWRTRDGGYSCAEHPDTVRDPDNGVGSHEPIKLIVKRRESL